MHTQASSILWTKSFSRLLGKGFFLSIDVVKVACTGLQSVIWQALKSYALSRLVLIVLFVILNALTNSSRFVPLLCLCHRVVWMAPFVNSQRHICTPTRVVLAVVGVTMWSLDSGEYSPALQTVWWYEELKLVFVFGVFFLLEQVMEHFTTGNISNPTKNVESNVSKD